MQAYVSAPTHQVSSSATMQLWSVLVALAVAAEALHSPLGKQFPKKSQHVVPGVGGDALFLTPYIQAGDLETARGLSKVRA